MNPYLMQLLQGTSMPMALQGLSQQGPMDTSVFRPGIGPGRNPQPPMMQGFSVPGAGSNPTPDLPLPLQAARAAGQFLPGLSEMGLPARPGKEDLLGALEALGGAAGRIATSKPFDPSTASTDFFRDAQRVGNELLGFPSALSGAWDAYQQHIGQPFTDWVKGPLAGYFTQRADQQPGPEAAQPNAPRFIAGLGGDVQQPQGAAAGTVTPAAANPPQVTADQAKTATQGNVPVFWNILTTEGGFAPHQAAGIIGRLQQESGQGLNTSAAGDKINGKPTSFGAAQWHKERFTALKNFAKEQGTEWTDTATQARFILHEMNTTERFAGDLLRNASTPEEAAEAMMHYERPKGYTRDNPRAGHGWNNTLRNAQIAYGALGVAAPAAGVPVGGAGLGAGLPPFPPEIGAPPMRQTQAPPDFSGMNQWLDQAQPTPPNLEALQGAGLNATMSGMLQGLGQVNMGQRGQFGRGMAMGGAGMLAGLGQAQLAEAQATEAHQRAMQQYSLERAGVSGDQALQLYRHEGLINDTEYANAIDVYNTGNVNLKNVHDWNTQVFALGQKAREAQQPQQIWAGKEGAIFMLPDGQIQTIASGLGEGATFSDIMKKEADVIKTLTDALGPEHPLVLEQTGRLAAANQNVQAAKNQVVGELVRGGQAQVMFPEEYAQAKEAAAQGIEPALMGDPEAYQAELNRRITAMLMMTLEARSDDWWVQTATQMGNPLAARLFMGGRTE